MKFFVNPEVKKMCHVFLNTLNKTLSEDERKAVYPRIEEWKNSHPHMTPDPIEERKKLLTRRLAIALMQAPISDPTATTVIKSIIASGADIRLGKGLIKIAVQSGNLDNVKLLIESGGDVNTIDANGKTPIFYAVEKESLDILRYLIAKGANVNVEDKDGNPLLLTAAVSKNKEILTVLISSGANVNTKGRGGRTSLDNAILKENTANITILIKAGGEASPVFQSNVVTILLSAFIRSHWSI